MMRLGPVGNIEHPVRRIGRLGSGPDEKSFEAVGEPGREALEPDLLDIIARFNRTAVN
jgi:hypothetical protein